LELLIVIVLMGMIFSMTTPLFTKTLASARLQTDARQLASLLRLARQTAISSGQGKTVVFYPNNAKYKVVGEAPYNLEPGISFVGNTTFTARVGGLPACGFSPSGAPSSGGTITLGSGDNRLYVIVNPVAGRVRISARPPDNW